MRPRLRMHAYGAPKQGAPDHEWEDAAAFSERRGRFVLSDGATSSFRSRDWSHLLAGALLAASGPLDDLQATVDHVEATWRAGAAQGDVPFYVRIAEERGAQATVLVVDVVHDDDGRVRWSAAAVGDTCVFHCRGAELLAAFPIDDPARFGSVTRLVATPASDGRVVVPEPERRGGELRVGDVLLGATDALAHWLLSAHAAGCGAWEVFARLDAAAFGPVIDLLRAEGDLHDDDVTFVRARLEGTER